MTPTTINSIDPKSPKHPFIARQTPTRTPPRYPVSSTTGKVSSSEPRTSTRRISPFSISSFPSSSNPGPSRSKAPAFVTKVGIGPSVQVLSLDQVFPLATRYVISNGDATYTTKSKPLFQHKS
ncbi:hypothetical protein P691DRAFT_806276 [Macrolepiota fuliginosa MF-IS2]|uniref:Uncharacterized protein n=1 Tax=Macrolepiota fuliginosa MF-IS2 TaxID=1400762 RepID=A0A9P6C4K2_9AGAR|nr:hypothetical protein P691DRAFT_806276 [Macrolepiota fuliginosa MF-IS2]